MIQTALGSTSQEEVEKILKDICNTVVTEEDCRNQIIQDALNVSCDEELNDLWKLILADSPKKNEKEKSNEQSSSNQEEKDTITGNIKQENISQNEACFSLQLFSDKEISDDDDKESVMVCILFDKIYLKFSFKL